LLVLERRTGSLEHTVFREIGRFLNVGDLLVLNQTRVIPARLYARKIPSGGRVELLLLRRDDPLLWEVLVGGKGLVVGKKMQVENGPPAEIAAVLEGARRMVRFSEPLEGFLDKAGHVPLPPYIHTPLQDAQRYQTVYARQPGSAAAPTAGLHFTPQLLASLQNQGVRIAWVTLHVGLDTFAPVTEESPQQHKIHTEWCQLPAETAQAVNQARQAGKRIIAVGTTSVRTLESAVSGERVAPIEQPTSLYILPGYTFRAVDALITNFHLPRSTLIMLVSAFAGRQQVLDAYQAAIQHGYRFYSFGDAMLIL
jgi:S-adenosylmethionine:tRNA ribosyltransferase-isomerase